MQRTFNLKFVECDNPSLLAYLKYTRDLLSIVLVIVNLDFNKAQDGCVTLPLRNLNMDLKAQYLVQDMLPEPDGTDLPEANFMWQGAKNYVNLDPKACPAHIFRVFRKVRRENDFDYWL